MTVVTPKCRSECLFAEECLDWKSTMAENSKWASFVRAHRLSKSLNQSEFADLMGVSQQTVSRWESGTQLPDSAIQDRLRTELQMTALGSLAFWKRRIQASQGHDVLIARDLTILAASAKAEQLLGTRDQGIVGRLFSDILPEPEMQTEAGNTNGLNSIRQFSEIGFFDGLIRSIRLEMEWHSPSGSYSYKTDVWPVLTSDQTIVGHFSGAPVPTHTDPRGFRGIRFHDIDIQLNKDK
jgi:transcriptional regulator with XRE-family HTH domain